MAFFLVQFMPQQAPFGILADIADGGRAGTQLGADDLARELGEALVEGAEIGNPLFMLARHKLPDHGFGIDCRMLDLLQQR